MYKIVRLVVGGTWLKVRSVHGNTCYWIRPECPKAIERLKLVDIVAREEYRTTLVGTEQFQAL